MIESQSVIYDENSDIRMSDFNILFAEFFKKRKDPKDTSPLYVTNVQFSECISMFEMKIYVGEPLTADTSD